MPFARYTGFISCAPTEVAGRGRLPPLVARNLQLASVATEDLSTNRKTHAPVRAFRAASRLKGSTCDLGRETAPMVANGHPCGTGPSAKRHGWIALAGGQHDGATSGHRISSIQHEVHEHTRQFVGVRPNPQMLLRTASLDDRWRREPVQQRSERVDQFP